MLIFGHNSRLLPFIFIEIQMRSRTNVRVLLEKLMHMRYNNLKEFRMCVFAGRGAEIMDTEEKRKILHDAVDKLDGLQINKLYQLIRGIFGKVC